MSDRERMIEILSNVKLHINRRNSFGSYYTITECIADHLLANGIIVPPCKVGDNLYYIATCKTAEDFGKKYVAWEKVKQISINSHGKWLYLMENSLISFDEIGKIIFLTKEEAEKALAERLAMEDDR